MGVNIETAINYMYSLKERGISYSMNGSRTGSDGTGDCSGTIYQGLRNAGMPDAGWVLNTDSMHSWFEKNNWKQVANQTDWNAQRGDVTIFGQRGASGGAAGHVVLWISNTQFIHCTWLSDWDNGIRVDYETNKLFLYDMKWYTYRYNVDTGSSASKGTQTNSNSSQSANYYSTGNYFVALKDLQAWNRQWTKKDNTWLIKAGSKFAVREKIINSNGTVHAQVAGLSDTYVTMHKDYVKPQ